MTTALSVSASFRIPRMEIKWRRGHCCCRSSFFTDGKPRKSTGVESLQTRCACIRTISPSDFSRLIFFYLTFTSAPRGDHSIERRQLVRHTVKLSSHLVGHCWLLNSHDERLLYLRSSRAEGRRSPNMPLSPPPLEISTSISQRFLDQLAAR